MNEDLKTKHMAEAGYLGPEARAEALKQRAADNDRDAQPQRTPGSHCGFQAVRFPPFDLAGRETHTVYPIKYMVAVGGLSKGFQFYGPFTEDKFAARWIYNNLKRGTESRIYSIFDVREDA